MFPFAQSKKVTPNSDSNGHSEQGTKTIIQEFPPQPSSTQPEAEPKSNKLNLEQNAENLHKDGQNQKAEHQEFPCSYRGVRLSNSQTSSLRQRRGLSLKTKVTALAIALGTIPVFAVGSTAYYFANQAITKQIETVKQSSTVSLADKVNRFMFDRYADIEILSGLRAFSNPQVSKLLSRQQKEAQLNQFSKVYGYYDSIAVFDLDGNVIAQTQGKGLSNHRDRNYFQQVLKTDKPFISSPEKSKSTGQEALYLVAPIKDAATGKTIAIVRTQMPLERMTAVIANYSTGGDEYHLIDLSNNKIFAATERNRIGRNALSDFNGLEQLEKQGKGTLIPVNQIDNQRQLLAYSPLEKIEGLPNLNWGALIAIDTDVAFAAQRSLLLTLLLGTGVAALVVAAIAAYLADKATRPILTAADAVEKLGQGELDTRITVAGKDELATLGFNINLMADQLQNREQALLKNQEAQVEQSRFFANIAFMQVRNSQDLEPIFNKALKGARKILNTDRVVVYSFNENWQGTITAESVAEGWPRALGAQIDDPCFAEKYVERYRKGRVQATENIYTAGLAECHLKQLEPFAVKANLVVPILQDERLFGLLIAHQCSEPRAWQQSEINFLRQLASQLGSILNRLAFLEQQKAEKEKLQKRALELLMEVDPLSKGDLTIRASVTEDEIGTVADSYNSTILSLRKIVTQVQTAAKQVATTTTSSEVSIQELSAEALRQTEEITAALDQLQEMSNSIRAVAMSAEQAEAVVQQAMQTVEEGDVAMNCTVDGILAIQETVTETAQKVKRLGESSQKISKVVKLIGTFADQTNLLALNAAIEAARAGEEGRGFAVVADEVGTLARQSAEATAEIESLVAEIQSETNEVVAVMEVGTQQVIEGTKLVDETRQSLNRITIASAQLSELVQAITQATIAQSQVSESVTQTMSDVAAIANQTSTEATQVTASFKELLEVAQQLQATTAQFKVS